MPSHEVANSKRLSFIANNDFRIGRDEQNGNRWAVINPRTGAVYLGETIFDAIDAAQSWADGTKAKKNKERGSIIPLN